MLTLNKHAPIVVILSVRYLLGPLHQSSPKLSLTHLLVLFLNSLLSSLHILAASIFAGLSSFGECNNEITEINIVSGVCTGLHLSAALSYPY